MACDVLVAFGGRGPREVVWRGVVCGGLCCVVCPPWLLGMGAFRCGYRPQGQGLAARKRHAAEGKGGEIYAGSQPTGCLAPRWCGAVWGPLPYDLPGEVTKVVYGRDWLGDA